ncbi:MAG: hypothetical protein R3Y28_04860 [Candidatus Gastranaerophilales bacterium]
MEEIIEYKLSEQEFKKLEKIAEHLFCTSVILDYFCSKQPENEYLYYITPVVKYLKQEADIANSFFINWGINDSN